MDLRRELPKAALRASLLAGLSKAALFGVVGLIAARDHLNAASVSTGAVIALGLAFFTEYFWFYLPNIRRHEQLLERLGPAYEHDLQGQLATHSVRQLLQKWWFVGRWKQARKDGLL